MTPKTAADNPRAILENADLLKISIQDSERDVRTPVILAVGDEATTGSGATAVTTLTSGNFDKISEKFKDIVVVENTIKSDAARTGRTADEVLKVTTGTTDVPVVTYHLESAGRMRWDDDTNEDDIDAFQAGVKNGLRVIVGDNVDYLPMHTGDEAVIRFFGCIDSGTTGCADDEFVDLTDASLVLDEDQGSGRTDHSSDGDETAVAPWLNVLVNLPDSATGTINLQYIVYYTSERETLIGGAKQLDDRYDAITSTIHKPSFTKSEKASDNALTVKVKSDGDVTEQHLWLYETTRFSGRYEGYVRLTDADGDGRGKTGTAAINWGLRTRHAGGHGDADDPATNAYDGPAVLGVESSPITVEYKDTDGVTQILTVMLDTVPPDIQIDTPVHESEVQDTSPEFAGSFNDGDSGLREESFQLYVDNSNDANENGDINNALALDLNVNDSLGNDPYGLVVKPKDDDNLVRAIEDYTGYSATMQFGVIEHTDLYGINTTPDGIDQGLAYEKPKLLSVRGDRYDDGAATGTFADSVRIRITTGSPPNEKEVDPYNNTIDFHALVTDVAGNVGFSDSDDEGPRFIYNYGTKAKDRKADRYNVLGWYARHIFSLDEKDPEIYQEQSVTGFYGIDDNKKPVVNRSGILVAFDSAVDTDTIDNSTFEVTLDPANAQDTSPPKATVSDVTVVGRQVYLLLSQELASDATPSVRIAADKSISDLAGNRLTRGGMTAFDVKDGIAPKLAVTLSGGTGTGTGAEAPDKLTNKAMTITVAADEEINTTPSITVVCSNMKWTEGTGDDAEEKGLSEFTADRSGPLMEPSADFPLDNSSQDDPKYSPAIMFMCGDSTVEVRPQQVQSFSRPDLQWEYQWQNFGSDKALSDGKLTVVAYGRDRKSFASLKNRAPDGSPNVADTYNWGVATAEFNFDITKPKVIPTPANGEKVTDARPFVLLNYDDKSTVSVTKLTVDMTDRTAAVQTLGARRFLYWPESLAIGNHAVAVEAVDAAGNKTGTDEFSFKVAERATFDIKLVAGWNAVSLPANPIKPEIEEVFTEAIVDMVAAWDGENPEAPWSIATRMDGEWATHSDFATLTKISARYGYWVHAQGFVTQSVALVGKGNREDPSVVPADLVEIPTNPGWNFVGVIDQDGDQTQDNYGEALKNGTTAVTAGSYLGKNMRAYTWDAIRGRFDILDTGETVMIGDGIWVYYGAAIAP